MLALGDVASKRSEAMDSPLIPWAKDSADIPVEQLSLLSYFPPFAVVVYPVSLASNEEFSSQISLDP